MELVNHYLQRVESYLPGKNRDDIIKELSDDILSQIEDREADLGRPLTNDETVALLKQHGSPMQLAGRFQDSGNSVAFGRQLIGPVLFPFYIRVLGLSLLASLIIQVVIVLILRSLGDDVTIDDMLGGMLTHLLIQAGIITTIFAGVEATEARIPDSWIPGKKVDGEDPRRVSRWESAFELAILLAVFFWLLSLVVDTPLGFDPLPGPIDLAPIWYQIQIPILVITLAEIVQACVNLIKPEWSRFRLAAQVAVGCVWLALLLFMIAAGNWVVFRNADGSPAPDQYSINQWFFYGLVATAVISAIYTLRYLMKLIKSEHTPVNTVAAI